jgi:hypothetical protein
METGVAPVKKVNGKGLVVPVQVKEMGGKNGPAESRANGSAKGEGKANVKGKGREGRIDAL